MRAGWIENKTRTRLEILKSRGHEKRKRRALVTSRRANLAEAFRQAFPALFACRLVVRVGTQAITFTLFNGHAVHSHAFRRSRSSMVFFFRGQAVADMSHQGRMRA